MGEGAPLPNKKKWYPNFSLFHFTHPRGLIGAADHPDHAQSVDDPGEPAEQRQQQVEEHDRARSAAECHPDRRQEHRPEHGDAGEGDRGLGGGQGARRRRRRRRRRGEVLLLLLPAGRGVLRRRAAWIPQRRRRRRRQRRRRRRCWRPGRRQRWRRRRCRRLLLLLLRSCDGDLLRRGLGHLSRCCGLCDMGEERESSEEREGAKETPLFKQ